MRLILVERVEIKDFHSGVNVEKFPFKKTMNYLHVFKLNGSKLRCYKHKILKEPIEPKIIKLLQKSCTHCEKKKISEKLGC